MSYHILIGCYIISEWDCNNFLDKTACNFKNNHYFLALIRTFFALMDHFLVTCKFNHAHLIRDDRMQLHYLKVHREEYMADLAATREEYIRSIEHLKLPALTSVIAKKN